MIRRRTGLRKCANLPLFLLLHLLDGFAHFTDDHFGNIADGGNIDVTSLSRVIDRGLMNSGRSASLLIELIDKPGQLKEISSIIADCGGNVTGVHYEKGNTESINGCFLRIEMETRDNNHVKTIKNALREAGFRTTKG